MKKRVMGRPPAPWMYALANKKNLHDRPCTLLELSKEMDASYFSLRNFCAKNKVEGIFEATPRGVIKLFLLSHIQKAVKKYVNSYGPVK